jgi:hypothetical protein
VQPQDHFNIKSVIVELPYQFVAAGALTFAIQGVDFGSVGFSLPFGDGGGQTFIAVENTEYEIDAYIPFSLSPTGQVYKYSSGIFGNISMVNVPAVLNAQVISISAILKVQHNFALG